MTPSVAKNMAWRSRGMTWVETGSGFRPSFAATCSSTRGSMLAKVPTAPEMAQVAISSRALHQPFAAARKLGIGQRQLDAESRRFGVDAVAAADRDRVLVLEGARLQRGKQRVDIGEQNVAGARQLHGEAGVEHVRRGHALMDEAGVRPDEFGQMRQEGDDVVLGDALDLVDALDVERCRAALFPDGPRGLLRDHAESRPARRRHAPRSRTRCGSGSRATRWRPFPGANSEGS